ncbi:hypothetical protein [Roseibium sp.]|uniref:hypothetical protein n=1 Tax=Roseibium sp. TaxID=1936156 RepID=UPI003A982368
MRILRLIAVLAFAGLGGCVVVFPKTGALDKVHEAYRHEFASLAFTSPQSDFCTASERVDGFPVTRTEINAFRAKYGDDSPEAAHLTVLEGMIYLQMTQFGLARAYETQVQAAGAKLTSGTGEKVRDALFAETYGSLVSGWEATCNGAVHYTNRRILRESATKLSAPADNIEARLKAYTKEKTLAATEVDEGALYLMATAIRFRSNKIVFLQEAACGENGCSDPEISQAKGELGSAVCQMAPMLTADERSGLALENLNTEKVQGRLRYVVIYRDARALAGNPECGAN